MIIPSHRLTKIQSDLLTIAQADAIGDRNPALHERAIALFESIATARGIAAEICEVGAALDTTLLLLAAAETDRFSGDQMHCLLNPIQAKLQRAIEQWDRLI